LREKDESGAVPTLKEKHMWTDKSEHGIKVCAVGRVSPRLRAEQSPYDWKKRCHFVLEVPESHQRVLSREIGTSSFVFWSGLSRGQREGWVGVGDGGLCYCAQSLPPSSGKRII
jgi:hypothetical protein